MYIILLENVYVCMFYYSVLSRRVCSHSTIKKVFFFFYYYSLKLLFRYYTRMYKRLTRIIITTRKNCLIGIRHSPTTTRSRSVVHAISLLRKYPGVEGRRPTTSSKNKQQRVVRLSLLLLLLLILLTRRFDAAACRPVMILHMVSITVTTWVEPCITNGNHPFLEGSDNINNFTRTISL